MSKIKLLQKVRLKQPVIEGPVHDIRYSHAAGELEYLVEYTDAASEKHARWFPQSQLETADEAAE